MSEIGNHFAYEHNTKDEGNRIVNLMVREVCTDEMV